MMCKLSEICEFNPREYIPKGRIAKKVPMDALRPFCRDISAFSLEPYNGGTKFRNGDTLMARITPCLENGKTAKVEFLDDDEVGFGSTEYIVLRAIKGVCDPDFLFYLVRSSSVRAPAIKSMVGTSGRQRVQTDVLEQLVLDIPPLPVQQKIGSLLKSLDDKIELNLAINRNLEEQAKAIYKSWFIDFSAQGGTAPADWRTYRLSEFLPVKTGKKNANISSKQGRYPFFSCAQDYTWVDSYSYDGNAILVAGNGDFNVKFYNGKFEAYQRTYVLIPYEPKYAAWLFYAIQFHLDKITQGHRGSVINFITKGDLENFEFLAPNDLRTLPIVDTLDTINRTIALDNKENLKLAALRDTLLPRLMSGELDVSECNI